MDLENRQLNETNGGSARWSRRAIGLTLLLAMAGCSSKKPSQSTPGNTATSDIATTSTSNAPSASFTSSSPIVDVAPMPSSASSTPPSASSSNDVESTRESEVSSSSQTSDYPEPTSSAPATPASSASESAPADGVVTCPDTVTATAGDFTKSIIVDGTAREFLVHIPPTYDGTTPMPVVIDFHPLGGSGSQWKGSTNWGAKADEAGFIVAWPSGIGNSWNVGMCCSTARAEEVDDVAFTRAIIETLAVEACIDTRRVYASGCSNGGGMAFKVACEAADVIAAVAPVDFDCVVGPNAEDACGSCAPERPISEIQFRGTNDTAVPFTGGPGPRAEVTFPGAENNFARWGEINQCSGSPATLPENSACRTYPSCGGEAESTLCTVQNGSHCGSYQSFGIVDIAWARLRAHAL